MKVEFLINPALNENDGRHIYISDRIIIRIID